MADRISPGQTISDAELALYVEIDRAPAWRRDWLWRNMPDEARCARRWVAQTLAAIVAPPFAARARTRVFFAEVLEADTDPAPLGERILALGSVVSRRGPPPSDQFPQHWLDMGPVA